MNFFKLLGLIATFNDVTSAAREASPDGKPFYYTQRFWGAVVSLGSGILAYIGIQASIDQTVTTNQLVNLAIAAGPVITGIYGLALHIKGWVDAKNRKVALAKGHVINADAEKKK